MERQHKILAAYLQKIQTKELCTVITNCSKPIRFFKLWNSKISSKDCKRHRLRYVYNNAFELTQKIHTAYPAHWGLSTYSVIFISIIPHFPGSERNPREQPLSCHHSTNPLLIAWNRLAQYIPCQLHKVENAGLMWPSLLNWINSLSTPDTVCFPHFLDR